MPYNSLIGAGRFIDPAVVQTSATRGDDWYPYAAKMPLTPEATSQPKRHMTTFLLHSMAGPDLTSLEALWRYMNRTDITGECTWILDLAGRCAQTVEVDTRADNNYLANQFATSVETQDRGYLADPGIAATPWSDMQLAQLAGLAAWQVLHSRLDIPLRRADRGWNGGGIDGHRRYAEWSKYVGKTCPGQARWEQIDDVLDAARFIVDWRPSPTPAPDPMPPASPTHLEDPMIVVKTTDGGHYASFGYRTGALHIGTQITVEAAFLAGVALDASAGFPLTAVPAGSWPASVARVTKAQAFEIVGQPVTA